MIKLYRGGENETKAKPTKEVLRSRNVLDPVDLRKKAKGTVELLYRASTTMQNLFKNYPQLQKVKDEVKEKAQKFADEVFVSCNAYNTAKLSSFLSKKKTLKN